MTFRSQKSALEAKARSLEAENERLRAQHESLRDRHELLDAEARQRQRTDPRLRGQRWVGVMTSIASAVVAFVVMVLTGMLRGFPFWITAIVGGLVAALVLFLMERARARRSAEREGEGAT